MYNSPLKNMEFLYGTSFLAESIEDAIVSPSSPGDMIRRIGMDSNAMISFMREFLKDDRYLAVDLAHGLSRGQVIKSETIDHESIESS